MRENTLPALQTFRVEVTFFSGDERYAGESYSFEAVNWYSAEQAALEMSGASPYDDPRVPNLRREAVAREV
jgi:hypothetical protein